MSISYSLILFIATISMSLLILVSMYHISYPNKRTIISKNKTQNLHAIESPILRIFFIGDLSKSFRQRIGDLKVNCYFLTETGVYKL